MSGFAALLDWLWSFWDLVQTGCKWVIDGFFLLIRFTLYSIFDGLLVVIEAFFSALDLSSIAFNYAAAWGGLPTQFIWLITVTGLPQCLALLGAAYLIRLLLNLIPSWATRV